YNTGNFSRGFSNGYVDKVLTHAQIKVPALAPLTNKAPSTPPQAASTEPAQKPDQKPPAQTDGTPDGFSANPATDGFSQTRDSEPEARQQPDAWRFPASSFSIICYPSTPLRIWGRSLVCLY